MAEVKTKVTKTTLAKFIAGIPDATRRAEAKKVAALLKKLGPHSASSGACVYIKNLDRIDIAVLKKLITAAYGDMKKRHN